MTFADSVGSPVADDVPRRARLLELVDLARTNPARVGDEAAYELTSAVVPPRRLQWLVNELITLSADQGLPCERRGQLTEAVGAHLQCSKRRRLLRRASYQLIDLLADPCPQVRFWSAFSLGTIRARTARRALEIATSDSTEVEGWWSVGAEAADALAIINGTTVEWRMADRAGVAPSE